MEESLIFPHISSYFFGLIHKSILDYTQERKNRLSKQSSKKRESRKHMKTESNTAVVERPARTTKTSKVSIPFRNEAEVLKKLHLAGKETLNKTDHQNVATAAREASKALRKTEPQIASSLYYVFYKHTKLVKKTRNS